MTLVLIDEVWIGNRLLSLTLERWQLLLTSRTTLLSWSLTSSEGAVGPNYVLNKIFWLWAVRWYSVLNLVIIEASSVVKGISSVRSVLISLVLVLINFWLHLRVLLLSTTWLHSRSIVVQKPLSFKEVFPFSLYSFRLVRLQVLL